MRQSPMQYCQSRLVVFIQVRRTNQFISAGQPFGAVINLALQQIKYVVSPFQAGRLQCIVTVFTLGKRVGTVIEQQLSRLQAK